MVSFKSKNDNQQLTLLYHVLESTYSIERENEMLEKIIQKLADSLLLMKNIFLFFYSEKAFESTSDPR